MSGYEEREGWAKEGKAAVSCSSLTRIHGSKATLLFIYGEEEVVEVFIATVMIQPESVARLGMQLDARLPP